MTPDRAAALALALSVLVLALRVVQTLPAVG